MLPVELAGPPGLQRTNEEDFQRMNNLTVLPVPQFPLSAYLSQKGGNIIP